MKCICLFLVSVFLIACGADSADKELDEYGNDYVELPADKYNAVQVNNQISSIQKGTLAIVDSVFKADTNAVAQTLEDAIFEMEVSINRLKSLGESHEMAAYFSTAVINLLSFYKTEFETDFLNILPVLKKKNLTEKDNELLSAYDRQFVEKEAVLFKEIVVRQDSFALFFNIGLAN